jgi:hypothetical protein
LVSIASTELARKSIEETANSCNNSPDSGINQSEGRNYLSITSSSSCQLDMAAVNSGGRASSSSSSNSMIKTIPIIKSSPADPTDSPADDNSEAGLPRTPSPNPSPLGSCAGTSNPKLPSSSDSLKIPLRYQRSQSSSEKHYKKKFRDRKWEEYSDEGGGGDKYSGEYKHKSAKFRPKGKDWNFGM